MTYRNFCLTVLALAVAAPSFAASEDVNIDYSRMERDLRIMEGILDNMLAGGATGRFRLLSRSTKGYYLDGYGVIFSVRVSRPFSAQLGFFGSQEGYSYAYAFTVPGADGLDAKGKPVLAPKPQPGPKTTPEEEPFEQLRDSAVEFLRVYADAIGQLSAVHRVTVYLHDRGSGEPLYLISARKEDIVAHRSGKMTEAAFNDAIAITEGAETEALASQIDIMTYVLGTVLKDDKAVLAGLSSRGVRGIYLNDFGVLFLTTVPARRGAFAIVSTDRHSLNAEMDVLRYRLESIRGGVPAPPAPEREAHVKSVREREQRLRDAVEREKERVERWKDTCTTVFSDYGHTLRMLGDDQWIAIIADWESSNISTTPTSRSKATTIKVRKKDITAYNKGKINHSQLARRIVYSEYPPNRSQKPPSEK